MVRIAMKNVNKRFEPEVSPAKIGLLTIDPKLVLHSSAEAGFSIIEGTFAFYIV